MMGSKEEKDKFIWLNELFSYGTTGETIHIHLLKGLNSKIKEMGPDLTLEYVNELLIDALNQIIELTNIEDYKTVFAVSPLLSVGKFREKLELLGFKTEDAHPKFEKMFPKAKKLKQCSTPIDRLRKILELENETRSELDSRDSSWQDKIIYYKYEKLKEIGVIDYYGISLDKVMEHEKNNYNYRHNYPLKEKKHSRFTPKDGLEP